MPVLRSTTAYHHKGKLRRIRLFKAWRNMLDRCHGTNYAGNKNRAWAGLEVQFKSWPEFRAWALASGYSRARNSLDRERSAEGYGPDNCRWVSVSLNTSYMNLTRRKGTDMLERARKASQRKQTHAA